MTTQRARIPGMLPLRLLLPLVAHLGCAQVTDASNPGVCSLNCSKPAIPSSRLTIEPLIGGGVEDVCTADFASENSSTVPTDRPYSVRFRAFMKKSPAGIDIGAPLIQEDGGGGGAGAAGGGGAGEDEYPVSGVAFEPLIYGRMATEKTNDEFLDKDKRPTPARFAGIVTRSAEWCSDSCGIMTYEFWPYCLDGTTPNTVQASVLSGGAKVSGRATFTITAASATP